MDLLAERLIDTAPMSGPTLLLGLGGIGLYFAARFGTQALVGPKGYSSASAGSVALGHWVPTAAVAITAVLSGRSDIALAIAFASSIAALSLAVGMICFLTPGEPLPASRRVWPFLLPAALLPLVAGFGGSLNILHGLMLAGLGFAVLMVWRAQRSQPETVGEVLGSLEARTQDQHVEQNAADKPSAAQPLEYLHSGRPYANQKPPILVPALRVVEGVLAAGVAAVASVAVVRGIVLADETSVLFRANLLAAGVISPLLVLPLLSAGTDLAQRNRSGEGCSACVAVALLNLFALVPIIIGLWWFQTGDALAPKAIATGTRISGFDHVVQLLQQLPAVPFPLTVWRIDSVVLTVLGFALLPAAVGRWRIGRLEAVGLVAAYALYLLVTAMLVRRPGGL